MRKVNKLLCETEELINFGEISRQMSTFSFCMPSLSRYMLTGKALLSSALCTSMVNKCFDVLT